MSTKIAIGALVVLALIGILFPAMIPVVFFLSAIIIFQGLPLLFLLIPRRSERLSLPPGWKLRNFAEFCFSKNTFTQVLAPTLSDMQLEHIEALATGRPWKARIVLVRGYFSFWSAVVAQLPIPFAKLVYKIWKTTNTGS